ncbi:response regulator transcription factor [Paenibacillus abyssi]|uniref:DNA-binding response regulator n=1 Tax=Paenibacillus abyssi TaxID=1340531 RepID=A0A917G5L5_9BACL|nr:response regulator [Paenibacillus abyssi]GGG22916.1 hypothetical protein GCM10010916_44440 [Paenibacillus abyssi]
MDPHKDTFNVFIVEDEIGVRRSLIGKIKWDELNIRLMGQAQNAEEAYEAIKVHPPDIILLDMRMPGMGGMAFLEILNKEFPLIKIIVLSGYSDFEYAKKAIVCGASDYLLKPIIKEELEKALQKVVDELGIRMKNRKEKIEQHILLNQSVPLLKRNLLNTMLQGSQMDTHNLLEKIELMDINLRFGHYALAIINVIDYEAVKSFYGKNTALVFFAIENVMAETIPHTIHFVGFKSEFRENEYICIHGFDDPSEIREVLAGIYQKVTDNIETYNKTKINVSISRPFDSIMSTHPYYLETSYLWQDKEISRIAFYDDIDFGDAGLLHLWNAEKSGLLMDNIKQNDRKAIVTQIQELFAEAGKQYGEERAKYRELAAQIYRAVEMNLPKMQLSVRGQSEYSLPRFHEWIDSFELKDDMKYGLIQLLDDIAEVCNTSNYETKNVIQQAREYMDRCFYESLTLESMALKYHMNRTYFSELFKQETGCSFKKYLIQIRIEKAKELLAEKDMKAVNVALLVGFNDPIYFSNVFKKYTGRTIKEFKENA